MVKTGLIGNGYWGKIIELKLKKVSYLKFVQTSSNYNTKIFKTVDWIFVATPVETHFKIATDCIMAGANVFIEKPATTKESEYKKLIRLAKIKKVNIYISNVFLFRNELTGKKKIGDFITFTWYKNNQFKNSVVDDLLYHDLYILASVCGFKSAENIEIYFNDHNRLFFSLIYGGAKVYFNYRRGTNSEIKKLINLGDGAISLPKTKQDPLKEMITRCIYNDIDFNANFKLNLHTVKLMNTIKQRLQ